METLCTHGAFTSHSIVRVSQRGTRACTRQARGGAGLSSRESDVLSLESLARNIRAAVRGRVQSVPRAAGHAVRARTQRGPTVCSATATADAGSVPAPPASGIALKGMLRFYFAYLLFGCAVNTIGPMLPSLAAHIGLTTVQMGPLLTAKGLGGLAGSFLSPLLPLSLLMPGGLLSIAACFALIPLTSDLLQLSVVYVVAAAVYQAVSIAAHTLIAQEHGDNAGPHLNGINALFGAGSLLAPMLHASLAPALGGLGGPLATYWLIAAAALASAAPFLAELLRKAPPAKAGGAAGGAAAKADPHAADGPAAPFTRHELLVIGGAMALVACNVGAENCFGTWLYSYAVQSMRLGPQQAATAVSLFWGSFTLGRLIAVPLSAKLAPDRVLAYSLPLAIVGPLVALFVPSALGLGVTAVLAGLGLSTGFANSVSLLARFVKPTQTIQAAIQVAATAGYMVFPPAVAFLAHGSPLGVRTFLWIAFACAAVDLALVFAVGTGGRRLVEGRAAAAAAAARSMA